MNISVGVGVDLEQLQRAVNEPDQPQEAKKSVDEAVVPAPTTRKRARVKGGQFAGDDPATEKNEAWTESSGTEA
jgi:hypothetical protein